VRASVGDDYLSIVTKDKREKKKKESLFDGGLRPSRRENQIRGKERKDHKSKSGGTFASSSNVQKGEKKQPREKAFDPKS